MATSIGIRPVNSPIPSDPGYEHECGYSNSGSLSYRPRGRTTWAGESIAKHQVHGTIARILYPESDSVPISSRYTFKHPQSKDFMKINARKVKEIEGRCQTQLEADVKKGPVKGVHLGDKYTHIQPKVTAYMKTPRPQSARQCQQQSASPPQQQQQKQQQKPQSQQPHQKQQQKQQHKPQQKSKSSVSHAQRPQSARVYRSASLSQLDVREDFKELTKLAADKSQKSKNKNYLKENAKNVGTHKIARPPSVEHLVSLQKKKEKDLEEYRRGVIPTYLKERQNQWRRELEEMKRNAPDPSVPPGHTLMPKEERLKTLSLLHETHSSLTRELQQMPVRTDTYKLRTKKSELESKLAEIDDAIKIFSRNKVFIKINE